MRIIGIIFILIGAVACKGSAPSAQMPNPASVKCYDDGYRLEIRKDPKGNEYGICIDADGNECEEWAYFRGECKLERRVSHR